MQKYQYPGRLYSKEYCAGGDSSADYKVWFSHNAIRPYEQLIWMMTNAFHWGGECTIEGKRCVAVTVHISESHLLLFRFTLAQGVAEDPREYTRIETFLVPSEHEKLLLRGSFDAVPDRNSGCYEVTLDENGDQLSCVAEFGVNGCTLRVYGVEREFYFSGMGQQLVGNEYDLKQKTEEGGKGQMAKLCLVLLLIVGVAGGAYVCLLRSECVRLREALICSQEENRNLKRELVSKAKWTAQRAAFEGSVKQLRARVKEVRDGVAAIDKLIVGIDAEQSEAGTSCMVQDVSSTKKNSGDGQR